MNQGKRYIRNTVFVLYGTAALYVGMNRLYLSTVDAGTPQWLRSTLSLGLAAAPEPEPAPELKPADVALLRDFTRLSVAGDFTVEVVGAAQYKVSFTMAPDHPMQLRSWQKDGLLRLVGDDNSGGAVAVLRIETPALTSINAQNLSQLTLRGLQAQELSVNARNVAAVRLQENAVGHWKLYSNVPVDVRVDKATLSAGSLQTNGKLAIRYGE